jgi:hypothetical protein
MSFSQGSTRVRFIMTLTILEQTPSPSAARFKKEEENKNRENVQSETT